MQTENIIGAFQKGKKYTVKVRAYTGSGDEKKVGDWSNELVVEADDSGSLVPEKTGNFKYNDEYEYVSWNRIQNTYVSQYEVEVDGFCWGTVYMPILICLTRKVPKTSKDIKTMFTIQMPDEDNISMKYVDERCS